MARNRLFHAIHPFNRSNLYYEVGFLLLLRETSKIRSDAYAGSVYVLAKSECAHDRRVRVHRQSPSTTRTAFIWDCVLSNTGCMRRVGSIFARKGHSGEGLPSRVEVSSRNIRCYQAHIESCSSSNSVLDKTLKEWGEGGTGIPGGADVVRGLS